MKKPTRPVPKPTAAPTQTASGIPVHCRGCEIVDLADLRPYPGNPNRHPDEQVALLARIIRARGWRHPVIVSTFSGLVVAGHGRIEAARLLGVATVPVERQRFNSADEEREFLLSDNRLAELAERDNALVKDLLEQLDAGQTTDNGQLLADLTGYVEAERERLMLQEHQDGGQDAEPQTDRAEELRKEWGVNTGDLWRLGDHRLLCGDSTKAADVARCMAGKRAGAVLCDPPYGQNQKGVNHDAPEEHAGLMAAAVGRLPIDNGVVVAFQSPRTFHAWTDSARAAGFTFERMLWIYKAAQCTFPWRGWILKSESIPVCSIGKPDWQEVHPFAHDCYYLSEVSGELAKDAGWHGSVKPLSVVSDLLSRICPPGAVVFDGFCGSGTTIIAAENLGRKCYAMEISAAYCAVILQRYLDATGKRPERIDA
jgi:DNA modification methylase